MIMTKISWNDINDADSSLSSDPQDSQNQAPNVAEQQSVPSPQDNKLRNACDKWSLAKLQTHGGEDVWLYIPNSFYQQAEIVNSILQKCPVLDRILRIKGTGWNVLTDYRNAKRLIIEGVTKDNLLIRFIYSNKNGESSSRMEEKPKFEKKITYIEKSNKTSLMEKSLSYTEEKRQRVKYVQKNIYNKFEQSQKGTNMIERTRSPNSSQSIKGAKSAKRYVLKEKVTTPEINQANSAVLQSKLEEGKAVEEIKGPDILKNTEIIQENVIELNSDQSQEEEEAELKKKKKKNKKKKNKQKKSQKVDTSNPFSFFAE